MMITQCDPGNGYGGEPVPRPVLDNAMERRSRVRRLRGWGGERAQSAVGTVQNLLATDLRLCLQTRLSRSGRSGSNPGFSSYGA